MLTSVSSRLFSTNCCISPEFSCPDCRLSQAYSQHRFYASFKQRPLFPYIYKLSSPRSRMYRSFLSHNFALFSRFQCFGFMLFCYQFCMQFTFSLIILTIIHFTTVFYDISIPSLPSFNIAIHIKPSFKLFSFKNLIKQIINIIMT